MKHHYIILLSQSPPILRNKKLNGRSRPSEQPTGKYINVPLEALALLNVFFCSWSIGSTPPNATVAKLCTATHQAWLLADARDENPSFGLSASAKIFPWRCCLYPRFRSVTVGKATRRDAVCCTLTSVSWSSDAVLAGAVRRDCCLATTAAVANLVAAGFSTRTVA